MILLNTIMSLIFIFCCAYVSCNALKKYVSHSKNYEFILYWGLSFVLVGLTYFGILFKPFIEVEKVRLMVSMATHMTATFAWFLQLYAIAYVTKFCHRYDTPACRHCKVCKRKVIRISLQTIQIAAIVVATVLFIGFPIDTTVSSGIRVIGIPVLDAYYELLHFVVATIIGLMLIPYRKFKIHLYLGFLIVAISELMQVFNVLYFKYYNEAAIQIEWGIATAGMVVIFMEVMKLINHNEQHE